MSGEFIDVTLLECVITLCRYKIVRGALDFGGVVSRQTARSRYGSMSLPN